MTICYAYITPLKNAVILGTDTLFTIGKPAIAKDYHNKHLILNQQKCVIAHEGVDPLWGGKSVLKNIDERLLPTLSPNENLRNVGKIVYQFLQTGYSKLNILDPMSYQLCGFVDNRPTIIDFGFRGKEARFKQRTTSGGSLGAPAKVNAYFRENSHELTFSPTRDFVSENLSPSFSLDRCLDHVRRVIAVGIQIDKQLNGVNTTCGGGINLVVVTKEGVNWVEPRFDYGL